MATLNTSRAERVTVDIYNYDNLPLALTYTTGTPAVAVDLTDYQFEFILNSKAGVELASYSIYAGDLSTDYLSKTGDDVNVLNMEAMFEHIRDNYITEGERYTLIQVVTDDDGNPYVHVIWTINAKQY